MTSLAIGFLLLSSTVFGDLEHYEIRGTSCVKVKEQLYLIGGEVKHNDNWETLSNIYKKSLPPDPSTVQQKENGWSKVFMPNFEPSGSFITDAGIPGKDLIYYYSGLFSRKEDISLKSFNTTTETTNLVANGPTLLADEIERRRIPFNISLANQDLIINDVNPNQVVLMGGNIDGKSPLDNFRSLSIFYFDLRIWETYQVASFNHLYRITAVFKGNIYVFGRGFDYDKVKNDYKISRKEVEELKIIGSYNIQDNSWSTKLTRGSVAYKKIHYSYTQEGNLLYLVGNNDDETGIVYVLNLETFIWTSYNISKFTGYPKGCLTFHNNFLIHDFGDGNQRGTQFIDTTKWIPNEQTKLSNEAKQSNLTLYIIIGLLSGIIFLALVRFVLYLRRRASRLPPPKIIDAPILIEITPSSTFHETPELFTIGELTTEDYFRKDKILPKYKHDLKEFVYQSDVPTSKNEVDKKF